ncbi:exosporium protein C [Paenibacillus sp. N3/727]|uniref:exosporium protein C n=1 Tax=Paenibacillus sp. N3/727 TaxID=2925845 RepID=UPI001F53A8F5|nr:exosporium protein C [Paenibacillus sp. N3/727]UNK18848.1 exosporium protein C [Paenibacillus sp. N3/727]
MVRLLDYKAAQPRSRFLPGSFTIPRSPKRVSLATIKIKIPSHACHNQIELIATVGVRGVRRISGILFKIFRDGKEIFNTRQDVESASFSQPYVVTFQAIDKNVKSGTHVYTVTAENLASDTRARADVNGPISFSGLAIRTKK